MSSDFNFSIRRPSTCCQLSKETKSYLKTAGKIGGTTLLSTLIISTVVMGILLLLAQHGAHLGGINSISQMVDAKWIYTSFAAASLLGLIDIAIIIKLLRSNRKKNLRTSRTQSQKPILTSGSYSHIRIKEGFYDEIQMASFFGKNFLEEKIAPICSIPLSFYKSVDFKTQTGETVEVLILGTEPNPLCFFCKPGKREELLKNEFTGFIPLSRLESVIQTSFKENVKVELKNQQYWSYEITAFNYKFNIIAYKSNNKTFFHYSPTEAKEKQNMFIEQLENNGYEDGKFSDTYTIENLSASSRDKNRGFLNRELPGHCSVFRPKEGLQTKEKQLVYALAIKKKGEKTERIYFKDLDTRTRYIQKKLSGYLNSDDVERAIFTNLPQEASNLKENEYLICEKKVKRSKKEYTIYAILFGKKSEMPYDFWLDMRECAQECASGIYSMLTKVKSNK